MHQYYFVQAAALSMPRDNGDQIPPSVWAWHCRSRASLLTIFLIRKRLQRGAAVAFTVLG